MRKYTPIAVALLLAAAPPARVEAQGLPALPPRADRALPALAEAVTSPETTGAIPPGAAPRAIAAPASGPRTLVKVDAVRQPWCRSGITVGTGAGFCIVN